MIDPVTASNDRLRDTGRWGYTGELREDPVPVEEPRGGFSGNRLLWVALLAIAVIVAIALFANPM